MDVVKKYAISGSKILEHLSAVQVSGDGVTSSVLSSSFFFFNVDHLVFMEFVTLFLFSVLVLATRHVILAPSQGLELPHPCI